MKRGSVVGQRRVVVDRRVDVVGRLDRRVVVERHPGHRARRLGGDHRAVADRAVVAEPALGAERRVRADARAAGVVDVTLKSVPLGIGARGVITSLVGDARLVLPSRPRCVVGAQAGGFGLAALIGIVRPVRCASGSGSSWPFGSPG